MPEGCELAPWDRQTLPDGEQEPARWYALFQRFLNLGPTRSLAEAANVWRAENNQQARKNAPHSWINACEKWSWRARAAAWDLYCVQRDRDLKEQARKARADAWLKAEHDLGVQMAEKTAQMLKAFTPVTVRHEEDGKTIILTPTDWKARDIAALAQAASKLIRLSTNMDTERKHVTIEDLLSVLPPEYRDKVKEELGKGEE